LWHSICEYIRATRPNSLKNPVEKFTPQMKNAVLEEICQNIFEILTNCPLQDLDL
jgi:hypothetical protein